LGESISVKEFNEWFVFFDLAEHEKRIKDKEMSNDERSEKIKGLFGL